MFLCDVLISHPRHVAVSLQSLDVGLWLWGICVWEASWGQVEVDACRRGISASSFQICSTGLRCWILKLFLSHVNTPCFYGAGLSLVVPVKWNCNTTFFVFKWLATVLRRIVYGCDGQGVHILLPVLCMFEHPVKIEGLKSGAPELQEHCELIIHRFSFCFFLAKTPSLDGCVLWISTGSI